MSSEEIHLKIPFHSSSKIDVDKEEIIPLWTVKDVARYLRLKPDTVRAMARRGELPVLKVGRMWRFKQSDISSWVQNQEDT